MNKTTIVYKCPDCGTTEEAQYTLREMKIPRIIICWFCQVKGSSISMEPIERPSTKEVIYDYPLRPKGQESNI